MSYCACLECTKVCGNCREYKGVTECDDCGLVFCDFCESHDPDECDGWDPTPVNQWEVTEPRGPEPDTRGEHDPSL